jgi:hypothetical protein
MLMSQQCNWTCVIWWFHQWEHEEKKPQFNEYIELVLSDARPLPQKIDQRIMDTFWMLSSSICSRDICLIGPSCDSNDINTHVFLSQNMKPKIHIIPVQTCVFNTSHRNRHPLNKQGYKTMERKSFTVKKCKSSYLLVLYLILNYYPIWNFQFQASFCSNSHVSLIVWVKGSVMQTNERTHKSFKQ